MKNHGVRRFIAAFGRRLAAVWQDKRFFNNTAMNRLRKAAMNRRTP